MQIKTKKTPTTQNTLYRKVTVYIYDGGNLFLGGTFRDTYTLLVP